jgi:hypothetical protein
MTRTEDWFGVSRLAANATKSCSEAPGSFQTRVDAVVHFPAGFSPTPQIVNVNSYWNSVLCGGGNIAPASLQALV